ncbi:MAG TPA: hypothetical protein PKD85_23390, partial [Saprospiraceae bacterium]|nr:hypothetical protein [Saprospiraceae bacterium]
TLDREFDISSVFYNENIKVQHESNVFGMSDLEAVVTFILSSVYSGIAYDILKLGIIKMYNKFTSNGVNVIIKYSDFSFFKITDDQIVQIEKGNEVEINDLQEMFQILESKINKS